MAVQLGFWRFRLSNPHHFITSKKRAGGRIEDQLEPFLPPKQKCKLRIPFVYKFNRYVSSTLDTYQ
jgi:hypothetical protein